MTDQTGEFIDLFRQLEAVMREHSLTTDGPREFNGMLTSLARHDPFIQKRFSELDLCRQLRNILSHFPAVDGRRPLVPDKALLDVLRETMEHIEHPIRARDAAIPRDKLYTVNLLSPLRQTLERMRKQGFSHIPVMQGKRVIGVFSAGTVFTAISRGDMPQSENAVIGDMLEDIGLDAHENEQYAFVAADEPLTRVKEIFQRPKHSRQKVAVVFVTENGSREEVLLGMLTPWDVLRALED